MMQEIEARTGGRVKLGPSSLYYSLGRLAEAGLIAEGEGEGEGAEPHEERRRYYDLTPEGRRRLASESAVLADIVAHARAMGFVGGDG
jgi:DNA-binding PadR family transcriptional regulator